jgi:[ribosomal protein S18]-alanine N-acetyltransferase
MEIKIETASMRLIDKVFQIEEQCFDEEAFTKQQISYLLTDYNTIALAANVNNDITGFTITQLELDSDRLYGHIITINVASAYRRKGIGTRMLSEIETILKQKGIVEIQLEVREDNSAALKLYQKNGYQKIGKLENYYGRKHGLHLKKTL